MYQHIRVPTSGEQDHRQPGLHAERPRQPDHSLHRGGRHRGRHHAGDEEGRRRGGERRLRGQAQDRVDGDVLRREVLPGLRRERLAAGRDAAGRQGVRGVDQGPAHHAGGRRHPLHQRGPAAGAGPVRLPAAGALLQGRAEPAQAAGEDRHGHLPRELRGHLRGHRMAGRERRRPQGHQVPDRRDGRQEDPLPADLRDRHQAGVARGDRAAGAQGHPVCDRQQAQVGDPGAQGQHHEVHRRRLPRLGLCAGPEASSAVSCWTAGRG